MGFPRRNSIEKRLNVLAKHLEGSIDSGLVNDLRKEISYGEYGVGLENLCEQLLESDYRLAKVILDEIAEAARFMQLPTERWDFVMTLERQHREASKFLKWRISNDQAEHGFIDISAQPQS